MAPTDVVMPHSGQGMTVRRRSGQSKCKADGRTGCASAYRPPAIAAPRASRMFSSTGAVILPTLGSESDDLLDHELVGQILPRPGTARSQPARDLRRETVAARGR